MMSDHRQSPKQTYKGLFTGLSARLVLLTMIFVMLAEFLIWAPSVSRYRRDYLAELIGKAHLAMIAVDTLKPESVSTELEKELLFYTNTYGIVLNLKDQRMLMVGDTMPPQVDLDVDMSDDSFMGWINGALDTLGQNQNRVLRVMGPAPQNTDISVEIVIDENPMRQAMVDFSKRILGLSIVISLFTAMLVFFSLQWLMVRPIRRMTRNLGAFRERPEDESRVIKPASRTDEIGVAQRELRGMQEEIRQALGQKTRLAALGAAVARVNHDLRNTLATAVLVSERLAMVDDPSVQRVMPRLFAAINRAVRLCSQTLDYVNANDSKLQVEPFHLHELLVEVSVALRDSNFFDVEVNEDDDDDDPLKPYVGMRLTNNVSFEVTIMGDRYQLFRVFHNLALNARLAGASMMAIDAMVVGDVAEIDIRDDGPGLPEKTQENLFQPFAGSSRKGGTGLGLVIAHDLVTAHGGTIELATTGPEGTAFAVTLPAMEISMDDEDGEEEVWP